MIFLGLISLLQVWVLPGLLFLTIFKRINIIDKFILSISISIVANYILVFFLIFISNYNFAILSIIIVIEIILLILYFKKEILNLVNFNRKLKFKLRLEFIDFLLLFLFVIYLFLALSNIGEIIFPGDPLLMWDVWAKSFAEGKLPSNSMDYPQAYPILMSITYVLVGNLNIEFFSRSVVLIYPLMMWIVMIRILFVLPTIKNEVKIIFLIIFFLNLNQFRHNLYIGFVDPLLVFSTVVLGYSMILSQKYKFYKNKEIIIICLLAIVPGILKQTSLYISICFPLLFYFLNEKKINKLFLRNLSVYFFIFISILLPWYLYKVYLFNISQESLQLFNLSFFSNSNQFVARDFNDLIISLLLNIKHGFQLVFGNGYILVFILLVISFFKNDLAKYSLLLILPYFFLWSNIFANDARNFAFMLPLVAYSLSQGYLILTDISKKVYSIMFSKLINKHAFYNLVIFISFVLASTYILSEKRSSQVLLDKQYNKELQRSLYPDVNILLYNSFKNINQYDKIIIMYHQDFTKLPKFKNSITLSCSDEAVDYLIKNKNKKIYYLIKKDTCSEKFIKYFENQINKQILFELDNHILFFIRNF